MKSREPKTLRLSRKNDGLEPAVPRLSTRPHTRASETSPPARGERFQRHVPRRSSTLQLYKVKLQAKACAEAVGKGRSPLSGRSFCLPSCHESSVYHFVIPSGAEGSTPSDFAWALGHVAKETRPLRDESFALDIVALLSSPVAGPTHPWISDPAAQGAAGSKDLTAASSPTA